MNRCPLIMVAGCLLAACSGFSSVEADAGLETDVGSSARDGEPPVDTAAADLPGGDIATGGGSGPGPEGALPSGYCCESADDCRYRRCIDLGDGTRMCADLCFSGSICGGLVPGLTCNRATDQCEPESLPATCVQAGSFTHGSKPVGACCVATNDARAGSECLSNRCEQIGPASNPFICTRNCTAPGDCPPGFGCFNSGFGFASCVPATELYTCAD